MLANIQSRSGLKFWLSWLGMTMAAYAVGSYLSLLLRQWMVFGTTATAQYPSIFGLAKRQSALWPPGTMLGLLLITGLPLVGLIGLAQWLVLRRHTNISAAWILAASAGAFIAAPVESLIFSEAAADAGWLQRELLGLSNLSWIRILQYFLMSLVVSVLQWRLLRPHINEAAWWIPASVLITMVAFLLMSRTGLPFFEWRQALRWSPLASSLGIPMAERLAAMIPGLLMQTVKQGLLGLAIVILMQPRRVEQEAVPAVV
ncbi:MAG: hypothetical protein ACLFWD_08255 [Anaerolineales bacterium]